MPPSWQIASTTIRSLKWNKVPWGHAQFNSVISCWPWLWAPSWAWSGPSPDSGEKHWNSPINRDVVGGSTLRVACLVAWSFGIVFGSCVYVLSCDLPHTYLHNPAKPMTVAPLNNYHFKLLGVSNVSWATIMELMVAAMLILHIHTHKHTESNLLTLCSFWDRENKQTLEMNLVRFCFKVN